MFRKCQCDLDAKHDRHERLVKHSRDITIGSKRAIFLLHRIWGSASPQSTLEEAGAKIAEIEQTLWISVAKELHGQDPYQFLRAYTHGLQEYIEAISFWFYLKEDTLISQEQVERRLQFTISAVEDEKSTDDEASRSGSDGTAIQATVECKCVAVHVPAQEYMLGILDLTGELMRLAISSVAGGDLVRPVQLCGVMRQLHDAFAACSHGGREVSQKLRVLRQSLVKVENACYHLQVRGSEIPKHMLKDVFSAVNSNEITESFDEFTT